MANEEHLVRLMQASEKQNMADWNNWRRENAEVIPDLGGADLCDADLTRADLQHAILRGAKLRGASLMDARLFRADLTAANLSHAEFYRADLSCADLSSADLTQAELTDTALCYTDLHGADLSGADLTDANMTRADLSSSKLVRATLIGTELCEANLVDADLTGANLRNARLRGADLTGTDLGHASLPGALLIDTSLIGAKLINATLHDTNLTHADFSAADLRGADLCGADLCFTNLCGADLSGSRLIGAKLVGTKVSGANFRDARIGWTTFAAVDLSSARLLDLARHWGPSSVSIDTVYKSHRKIPNAFLSGAGVPADLIGFFPSSDGTTQVPSCLICSSQKDQDFAERLHVDLQAGGIACWFAPEGLEIGDVLCIPMSESILLYDKLIPILSENSISKSRIEKDAEAALEQERAHNRVILFPIRLDDAVLESKTKWAADIRNTREIGDFRDWRNDNSYQDALSRLLRDLKQTPGKE